MKYHIVSAIFLLLFCGVIYVKCSDMASETHILNGTVTSKDKRIVPSGKSMKEEFYVVVLKDDSTTETFTLRDDYIHGKFDNAGIFYALEPGKHYQFEVNGHGKSAIYDYRNILSADPY